MTNRYTEIYLQDGTVESIPYTAEEEGAADAQEAQQVAKEKALPDAQAALATLSTTIAALGKTYNQAQIQAALNAVLAALSAQQGLSVAFTPELGAKEKT